MNKVCKLNMIIGGYLFLLLLLALLGGDGWAQEQTQREAFRSRLLKVFQEAQREAEKSDIASIVEDAKYKVSKILNEDSPIFKLKTRCNLISTRREGNQNDCFQSIDQAPPPRRVCRDCRWASATAAAHGSGRSATPSATASIASTSW